MVVGRDIAGVPIVVYAMGRIVRRLIGGLRGCIVGLLTGMTCGVLDVVIWRLGRGSVRAAR